MCSTLKGHNTTIFSTKVTTLNSNLLNRSLHLLRKGSQVQSVVCIVAEWFQDKLTSILNDFQCLISKKLEVVDMVYKSKFELRRLSLSVFTSFAPTILPSILTSFPISANEKHPKHDTNSIFIRPKHPFSHITLLQHGLWQTLKVCFNFFPAMAFLLSIFFFKLSHDGHKTCKGWQYKSWKIVCQLCTYKWWLEDLIAPTDLSSSLKYSLWIFAKGTKICTQKFTVLCLKFNSRCTYPICRYTQEGVTNKTGWWLGAGINKVETEKDSMWMASLPL